MLHSDTPHSVGLLWTSDQSPAETSTWRTQNSQERAIRAPGRIRTRSPSKPAAANLTPYTMRSPGSALRCVAQCKSMQIKDRPILFGTGSWFVTPSAILLCVCVRTNVAVGRPTSPPAQRLTPAGFVWVRCAPVGLPATAVGEQKLAWEGARA
jgi:hypothetical protein